MKDNLLAHLENDYNIEVRTIEADGETWYNARDILIPLGYHNVSVTINDKCLKSGIAKFKVDSGRGGMQTYLYISHSNFCRIILTSKKGKVKKLQNWLLNNLAQAV